MNTKNRYRTALALIVIAFGLLYACSSTASEDDGATPVETDSVETTPVETDPVEVIPVEAAPAVDTFTGDGGQGGDGGAGPDGIAECQDDCGDATPAPVIDSFVTPDSIDCHNGNDQTFTASWTTTNAVQVEITSDDGVPHGSFDPDGTTSLPFNCSSSHTFHLTALGANLQEATTSVTLNPRNVVQPPGDFDLEDAADELAPEGS